MQHANVLFSGKKEKRESPSSESFLKLYNILSGDNYLAASEACKMVCVSTKPD